jgi:hypothetical protein
MSISAYEQVRQRKMDDWNEMLEDFIDNPQSATNHLVFGMDLEQRRQAKGLPSKNAVPTWV